MSSVDACRVVLGRADTNKGWLADKSIDELVDVYRWAVEHDPALLRDMQHRQSTRDAILLAA